MKNTKAFKIFESEFKNKNVTWFSDEALNFLKETLPSLTVKEQEDILYVILTVNFKKGTNNIKKLCRLISESYFTVPIVNIFWNSINHIFSFEVSSNSENPITTFPHFTTTELDNLYSVIAKEMDFTETVAVRKLCRLITDDYLPIYLVDRLRKQFNFVKKHEKAEGKEDNLFPLIAVSLSEENRDRYGNLILAFDKFYKDKLGVKIGVLNLLDTIETETKQL